VVGFRKFALLPFEHPTPLNPMPASNLPARDFLSAYFSTVENSNALHASFTPA
jgi:hypothetical protein